LSAFAEVCTCEIFISDFDKRSGKGGDGCAAFHREKFVPNGPPSGGDGGRGGDVYFLPVPTLTSLASIPKKIQAASGGNGQGTWLTGKTASPTIIKVPLGTVVRQLAWDDPRRAHDAWEAEEDSLQDLEPSEKRDKMRDKRWVHYPRYAEENVERDAFKEAEEHLYQQERTRRLELRRRHRESPLTLDLNTEEDYERPADAPLGTKLPKALGKLIASGGQGGLGNPHFVTTEVRSPKYATRGHEGERLTLMLELKLLADVGLVGVPNAGKSTLLRALTGGRAKTEVAGYAFTTLNPVVGIVRVAEDGTFEGSVSGQNVHEETSIEEARLEEQMVKGELASAPTRNQASQEIDPEHATTPFKSGHHFDLFETFRFTIADNPGLIEHASDNVGLGHAFLRSIERSLALVYVVDFAGPNPWDELLVLKEELEKYKPGMSKKARMVIANKADLLGSGGEEDVQQAMEKLVKLKEFVGKELGPLDVVPVSAKYSMNLQKVVGLMKDYVIEERAQQEKDANA